MCRLFAALVGLIAANVIASNLQFSEPAGGGTLPRTLNNAIHLTFSEPVSPPNTGDLLVREVLIGGDVGPLVAGITFDSDGAQVIVVDSASLMEDGKRYRVENEGAWFGVAPFELEFDVIVGDADGNGQVDEQDIAFTNTYVGHAAVNPNTIRSDVNGDGTVGFSDMAAIHRLITGKSSAAAGTASIVFAPVCSSVVPPGEPVIFEARVFTPNNAPIMSVDAVIGSSDALLTFEYSQEALDGFIFIANPPQPLGIYAFDLYTGGFTPVGLDSGFLLGTATVVTELLSPGEYAIQVDSGFTAGFDNVNGVFGLSGIGSFAVRNTPQSACCDLTSGACAVEPSEACSGSGVAFAGVGVDCAHVDEICRPVMSDTPCPLAGACCDEITGECTNGILRDACIPSPDAQATWTQAFDCEDVSCSAEVAACCVVNGGVTAECLVNSFAECLALAGDWVDGETCQTHECADVSIPTTSAWGLVALALILVIGVKLRSQKLDFGKS